MLPNADGTVLPNPGIPKTLGILNVIFGVLLVLFGTCFTGTMIAAPALMDLAEKATKDAVAKQEARQKSRLDALNEREKTAKTDDEKKGIQAERDAIAAETKIEHPDMGPIKELVENPLSMGYNLAYSGTGVFLSVFLLISGVGLVRLTSWGRSLAIGWAGLQIVQILVFTTVSLLYVQPALRPKAEAMLENMEAKAKAANTPPGMAEGARMGKAMSKLGPAFAIGFVIVGMIYPVTLLVLLNGAPAKAACLTRAKPPTDPGAV